MRHLVALVAGVSIGLAAPGLAQAKELTGVELCGPDDCRSAEVVGGGHEGPFAGGPEFDGEPPGPYYAANLEVDGHARAWTMFYVPSARRLAFEAEGGSFQWASPSPPLARALDELVRAVEPYAGPAVTSVSVGGRRVTGDPASYLRLFAVDGSYADPGSGPSAAIRIDTTRPSPWSGIRFRYYFDTGVLGHALGFYLKLPSGLADDVAAGRALGAGGVSERLAGWAIVLIVVGGAALAAAAAWLLGRGRRAAPQPVPSP